MVRSAGCGRGGGGGGAGTLDVNGDVLNVGTLNIGGNANEGSSGGGGWMCSGSGGGGGGAIGLIITAPCSRSSGRLKLKFEIFGLRALRNT